MRKSGILLPISALPSNYGIGTISKEAYQFVDCLAKAGQKYWQILPLGPTGYGDSPYQSFSTFAGNPYYIDLEALIERGWLTKEDCESVDAGSNPNYVDYEKIYYSRFELLRKAFHNSGIEKDEEFQAFVAKNNYWLEDYALYMAVKSKMDNKGFIEWDDDIKLRKPEAIARYKKECKDEMAFYCFQQFLFHVQWMELKNYANKNGVEIIGDIPIYVASDSADTWANPELFQLEEDCTPKAVAGCPPDAFSATGQLWGNPLYDWEYHKETGYDWWMKRIAYCYEIYDVVRIDHFRGFDEYYSIPYGDKTAEFGHWEKGPGYDLFETMKARLGDKRVIAEDLGFLTQSVLDLVAKTGFPGMKILQFAFDSREDSDYLPHNYPKNCVVYTGTHDNDTTLGWYNTILDADREFADDYLNIQSDKDVEMNFVRAALASVADTAIIPMQDYLGLGSEARINTPSTLGDNWKWRMGKDDFSEEVIEKIYAMTKLYAR
ncbi:MAG: 4-alpha-glucanotransferase [Lachnospiraceae bacterium]|nr:4-alpha-glucanotransferase [Lachnospiraceae bacterium]MBR3684343.1 4-alpha-glucanotransferase [Lachnospiraceae bacterium]